jgi:hypothetical protein
LAEKTFLHFSWGNFRGDKEACAIRDYVSGNSDPIRKYKTSEIEKIASKIYVINRRIANDKVSEWKALIAEYNRKYLND